MLNRQEMNRHQSNSPQHTNKKQDNHSTSPILVILSKINCLPSCEHRLTCIVTRAREILNEVLRIRPKQTMTLGELASKLEIDLDFLGDFLRTHFARSLDFPPAIPFFFSAAG
jgi:hypothetical protein